MHSLSQLLALLGQIVANPETVNYGRCLIKPTSKLAYPNPLILPEVRQLGQFRSAKAPTQIIYTESQGRRFEECNKLARLFPERRPTNAALGSRRCRRRLVIGGELTFHVLASIIRRNHRRLASVLDAIM